MQTTSQQASFVAEIVDEAAVIPAGKLAYFQADLRIRLYELVLMQFAKSRLKKSDIARRIGRDPGLVTRWLSAPNNWTIDTVGALLLALGLKLTVGVSRFADEVADITAGEQLATSSQDIFPQPRKPHLESLLSSGNTRLQRGIHLVEGQDAQAAA